MIDKGRELRNQFSIFFCYEKGDYLIVVGVCQNMAYICDRGDRMAIMIPDVLRGTVTAGERMVFKTLREHLPDDYLVYFEPEIAGRYPDFVIIGPDIGIVVLEVKDYTRAKLQSVNSDTWTILTDAGEKRITSPLKQARDYMFKIMNRLEKDKDLVQLEGKYKMKLKFPCGYGTVFTRLTQKQFIEDDLYDVVPPNLCFTRDEIDCDSEDFNVELFFEKLLSMFSVPFRLTMPLTDEDINRIRFHLFPEVRISAEKGERTPYNDEILLSLYDIKVMDLHQEKLAKQLGDKNRLIRGVAGSGKTIILASRAKLLAKQHPEWRILVLCYNISLARNIETMITYMMNEPEDLFDFVEKIEPHKIEVRNFHQFLYNDLKMNEQRIQHIVEQIDKGQRIVPKYDAILIDEGQDFDESWYLLISRLLNPETKSLLLVEDRAQDIYRRKRSLLHDIGLDFRGRSKVLNINYRNTAEIVHFAWDFYQSFSKLKNKLIAANINDEIIIPKSTKRTGKPPYIRKYDNFFEEVNFVAAQIERLYKARGVPLEEILILYRVKYASNWPYVEILIRALRARNIPYYWITENESTKRQFKRDEPSVKICTIDSSKGLDFGAVFFIAMHEMPFVKEQEFEKEVSRAYIGMTRSKQYLSITGSGDSAFMAYFLNRKVEQKPLDENQSNIQ